MKKYFINNLINLLLLIIFIFIFFYSNLIKESIIFALDIWKNNLITTIFPFLLLSNLLIEYGFIDIINALIGRFISKIYNLPRTASFAVIMSLFTGFPTGSKYTKDLLEKKLISEDDANTLITFTSYSNPLFVISGIGQNLLNNKRLGIKIYIVHVITGLITGLFFRNKKYIEKTYIKKETHNSFINNLIQSIRSSFNILVNMLGIIIFFLIIITILNKLIKNKFISIIVKGILEITTFVTEISKSKMNLKLKVSLIGAFLSFNGLSIHSQTKSIIENTSIKYKRYLIARIIHSLLCFIILYIFVY